MMKAPTKFLDIDFETRSELDITVVGARVYAEHDSTEILMISFSADEENVYNWNPFFPDEKIYQKLKMYIKSVVKRRRAIRAQNSEFEMWIWNLVSTRQFGWPEMPVESFYDTMVMGCIRGYPASLENAGTALDLPTQKDKNGKALINFFSKPSRKQGEKWKSPIEYKSKFMEFVSYCDDDVHTQIGIVKNTGLMTQKQWEIFILTEKMNIRGLPIDKKMAEGALKLVDVYKRRADKQIQKITNNQIESATQNVALNKWLNEQGCNIPNMQAAVIEKYLNNENTSTLAKQVLRLRSNVSKSSTAKYKAALVYLTKNCTVHGFLKSFVARTGRWAGRGLQIQNFSKPDKDFPYWCDYDILAQAIAEVDMRFIETIYGDVMGSLKAATRSMIKAPKGKKFICADYSQIEARIVMWIAGDIIGLKDFSGEGKIYESMAADIFGVSIDKIEKPSFERDVGKEVVLGCGFGMGINKFIFRCVEQRNLKVTKEVGTKGVKGYRTRYKKVQIGWKECESAAIGAIQNPNAVYNACGGKLKYKMVGDSLVVKLPSGRQLYYPEAKAKLEINDFGKEQYNIYYKLWNMQAPAGRKWEYERTWGGTLFQHAVQATAMDIMAHGMLKAETKGYPALFTVHDESLSMVDSDFGSVSEYESILCDIPSWAKGLPIVAEGWEGNRYKK